MTPDDGPTTHGEATPAPDPLGRFRRIVVKVGSALLVDPADGLRADWLATLAADIAALRRGDDTARAVVVVSSGAIALGRQVLRLPAGPLRLDESQAAAAVGQIALSRAWAEALSAHDVTAAQILLTLPDTEGGSGRRSYLNARDTLARLLSLGSVPVVNENDTVATSEIRYGDNDRLAARVATMVGADALVLFSDVDGLYTAPPARDPHARLVPVVDAVTPQIAAMAGVSSNATARGGMVTKVEAARIATAAGCAMLIARGEPDHPLRTLRGGAPHTLFRAPPSDGRSRKAWIGGQLRPAGRLLVDEGAARALRRGKSLLPAGVTRVEGSFERGDPVAIETGDGTRLAVGLAGYDAREAAAIAGRRSEELEAVLGYGGRAALIHRDDMAMVTT